MGYCIVSVGSSSVRNGPKEERNWFEHSANDMKLYLPEIFDLGVFHGSRRFIDITQSGILTSGIYIFFRPKNLFLILTEISLMCEKINNNPEKKSETYFPSSFWEMYASSNFLSVRRCTGSRKGRSRSLLSMSLSPSPSSWLCEEREQHKSVTNCRGDISCNRCPCE